MKALKLKIQKMNEAVAAYTAACEEASELCAAIKFRIESMTLYDGRVVDLTVSDGGDEWLASLEVQKVALRKARTAVKSVAVALGFNLKTDLKSETQLSQTAWELTSLFESAFRALHNVSRYNCYIEVAACD